jgi:glyceraldehyde-3-phosphate dehydrogenase (NADP+)
MDMYVAGRWIAGETTIPVVNPYDDAVIDHVPAATAADVEAALEAAVAGAAQMRRLAAHERMAILMRAADLLDERSEEIAMTISLEVGKPLAEAAPMPARCADIIRLAAFEGAHARGETLPLDTQPGAEGKLGFTLREPCGVVLAITPFNYPLLLVVHKVAPALAAGNAVILKPATYTPLTALKLTEIFLEAGLPENGLQCITGAGGDLGAALSSDHRVRKISFTGSTAVGQQIAATAGVKRMSLELGANCPMVVLPDADLEEAARAAAVAGTVNAGQVCISLQNVFVHREVYGDFLEAVTPAVASLPVGNPQAPDTRVGSMITPGESQRVRSWIDEAVADGARLLTGAEVDGAVMTPAVVADLEPDMRLMRQELFGPAIGVAEVRNVDDALRLVNESDYGLAATIFTQDVTNALRFAREAQTGNVHVNWTPLWRADFMPYGGIKGSGIGKEGPRYAVNEMTELKTVIIHGLGRA